MRNLNVKGLLSVAVLLNLTQVSLITYLGYWREWYWTAVQTKNLHDFWLLLGKFTVVALALCVAYGLGQYLLNYVALDYRRKLSRKALQFDLSHIEGFRQRIQEDCMTYPMIGLTVSMAVFQNSLIFICFSYLIIHQIGIIYLLIPIIYAILSTSIGFYVAKPLINLNYVNQLLEAKFRQTLVRRDYAKAHRNNAEMFKATKKLSYFQSFYSQITVIIPIVILASDYFGGHISFGVLMQSSAAIGEVISGLSIIIVSYNDINRFLSARRRLKEMEVI